MMWKVWLATFLMVVTIGGIGAAGYGTPCTQPMDPGPCDGYFPRWFFNFMTGECKEFIYGGCDGNDNNFLTWADCMEMCDESSESSESSEEGSGSSSSSSEGSLSLSGSSSSSNSSESSSSSSESMETRRDRCSIDIVLVLDDSSSITVFQHALSYMVNFTRCRLRNETVEIGVIVYNCLPRTEIPLGLYTAGDLGLEADIEYIMQQGGLSRTAPAIRYMKDTTPWRDGADRVAIVLTDGFPQGEPLDDHKAEANAARAEQIKMYSVGLGDPVDNKVLKDIATGASRVFDDTDPCDLYYRIVKRCGKKRRNGSGGVSSHGSSSSSDSDDSSDSSDSSDYSDSSGYSDSSDYSDYSDSSDSSDSSYMMG